LRKGKANSQAIALLKNKRAKQFALLRRGCTSANLIELFSYKWSVGVILQLF